MTQKQLIDEAAREMAEAIDFEVLCDVLVNGCGWTLLVSPVFPEQGLVNWLHQNCKGRWKRRGDIIVFESKKDANWFTLKWGAHAI